MSDSTSRDLDVIVCGGGPSGFIAARSPSGMSETSSSDCWAMSLCWTVTGPASVFSVTLEESSAETMPRIVWPPLVCNTVC